MAAAVGIGIQDILEAVGTRVPPPAGPTIRPRRMLVFDSKYDAYRGVIHTCGFFRTFRSGEMMMLMSSGQKSEIKEVGNVPRA